MANKVYEIRETTIVFGSEAGDDVDWSTESVGSGAGRQSDQADLGVLSTARFTEFEVLFYTQAQATPTVGDACYLFTKSADTTVATTARAQNDDGLSDAAVSAEDKLRNLPCVGAAICDEAAANIEYVLADRGAQLRRRYVQMVLWNSLGATITSDVAETKAELTPVGPEIQ